MRRKPASKTSNIVFLAVLILLVCICVSVLYPELKKTQKTRAKLEQLKQEKVQRQFEISCLEREIKNMQQPEYIEKAAREELGLLRRDEKKVIYK